MTAHDSPWQTGGLPVLNVAATCAATRALGPGVRAVVWVQGCPFHCPGCIAPDWIPRSVARLISPEDLTEELLAHPEVTGLTLSGGEPMLQAAGLAALVKRGRQRRDLSVVCFTGFSLQSLRESPPGPGVPELLSEIDVLIGGLYVAARNDGRGLRGSTNQRFHFLTDRFTRSGYDFANRPRQAELRVSDGSVLLVGVPPLGLPQAFHDALARATTALRNTMTGGSQ